MADIFLSYSKQDPEHTDTLAADLEAHGFSTWWDTSLLPGDEFPDLIKRQIDMAKAVIVIWTPHSVASRWVRAEAYRAYDQDKLIMVHTPGIDFRDISRFAMKMDEAWRPAARMRGIGTRRRLTSATQAPGTSCF